jgi:hypothetical protein
VNLNGSQWYPLSQTGPDGDGLRRLWLAHVQNLGIPTPTAGDGRGPGQGARFRPLKTVAPAQNRSRATDASSGPPGAAPALAATGQARAPTDHGIGEPLTLRNASLLQPPGHWHVCTGDRPQEASTAEPWSACQSASGSQSVPQSESVDWRASPHDVGMRQCRPSFACLAMPVSSPPPCGSPLPQRSEQARPGGSGLSSANSLPFLRNPHPTVKRCRKQLNAERPARRDRRAGL